MNDNDQPANLSDVLKAMRHLEDVIQATQSVPVPVFMVMSMTALSIIHEYPQNMFDEQEQDLIATIARRAVDMDFTNA